jgi:type I restriction enzyme, S subunit
VWIVPERSGMRQIASGEWVVFRGEDIAPAFLRRMLLTKPFHEKFMQTVAGMGGSLDRARPSEVARIEIPVPASIEEQRRIATVLDKADAILQKREKLVALADNLLESAFIKMFGDPVSNPRGWPLRSAGDLGDVQGGLQVTSTRDDLPLRRPYLRVANVYRDRLALSEIKDIGLTDGELSRVQLESGDVLFVEGHGNPDEIGRCAVWDGSIENCVHQNHLIRFRADRTTILPTYLSRLLNSKGGRLQLVAAGRTTSGLNTISTRKIKELRIPVPPIQEQQKFSNFVQALERAAKRARGASASASDLLACLSQQAFRGELREQA